MAPPISGSTKTAMSSSWLGQDSGPTLSLDASGRISLDPSYPQRQDFSPSETSSLLRGPFRFGTSEHCTLNQLENFAPVPSSGPATAFTFETESYMSTPSLVDSLSPSSCNPRTWPEEIVPYGSHPTLPPVSEDDAQHTFAYNLATGSCFQAPTSYPYLPTGCSVETRNQHDFLSPHLESVKLESPSPAAAQSSCKSKGLRKRTYEEAALSVDESEEDDANTEEPYAKLIYRCMKGAPDYRMKLKEIYDWFEKNTSKAKNSDSKGWQNSIRHNLSMNAAFVGVKDDQSGSKKTGNTWVLTQKAIEKGVQSTTRYRKQGTTRKAGRSENPAPQRQRSGAKGGKAAKKAAKLRRVELGELADRNHGRRTDPPRMQSRRNSGAMRTHGRPVQMREMQVHSPLTPTTNPISNPFDFGRVVGVADISPHLPFFSDLEHPEDPTSSAYQFYNAQDEYSNHDFFMNFPSY